MKARTVRLILSVIVASSAAAAAEEPSRLPIIDVHVHVYANDPRWEHKVPNPVTGREMVATTEETHMRATFDEMERSNVVKAVASNDYATVLRWKEAAPDRIIASYGNVGHAPPDRAFLRSEHAAGRLQVLGELEMQYLGMSPDDPKMDPWFALAQELDLPVGIHMGPTKPGGIYEAYPEYRAALGAPLLLEKVLVRYPKLRVYVMHAGWPLLDQMIALMWAHPQVYVDCSVINWALPRKEFHAYLERLVDSGFGDRIMFGSDQMVWPEAIGMAIEGIESAAFLSAKQKRDIFYNNAVEFFRLTNN